MTHGRLLGRPTLGGMLSGMERLPRGICYLRRALLALGPLVMNQAPPS